MTGDKVTGGQNDQGTKWLETKWPGDKVTKGQSDQGTKWPGTKWPGTKGPGDKVTGTKWPGTKWKGTKCRVTIKSNTNGHICQHWMYRCLYSRKAKYSIEETYYSSCHCTNTVLLCPQMWLHCLTSFTGELDCFQRLHIGVLYLFGSNSVNVCYVCANVRMHGIW
jgi:hypothetical protein